PPRQAPEDRERTRGFDGDNTPASPGPSASRADLPEPVARRTGRSRAQPRHPHPRPRVTDLLPAAAPLVRWGDHKQADTVGKNGAGFFGTFRVCDFIQWSQVWS